MGNVSNVFATLNIQIKLMTNDSADEILDNSKIILLLRHEKLPTLNNCDLVQTVSTIKHRTNESYADWFIGNKFMKKGKWLLAVASLKTNFENDVIQNMKSCQENNLNLEMLSWEFQIANYTLRSFIGGAYYFDESREEWNGYGINIKNTSNLITAFEVDHLTSFGSGFLPEPNAIDFAFIFTRVSFSDHMTIFI